MLETVGAYRVLEWIGAGEIGEVCRARDTRVGRTVALTILASEIAADPDRRAAFLADAKAAASLSHPNIAALYDIGEEHDRVFLAQEFVPGDRLARLIAGHPLNARRAVEYAAQIADALADAHSAGIQHGHLSTRSVIITPKGNAKLVEFGLGAWTRDGRSHWSGDLASLGAVLFEMTTGRPVEAEGRPVVAPSSLNRQLPGEIDAIVRRLLGGDIRASYESAAVVAAELRAVAALLDGRQTARGPASVTAIGREAGSRRWLWVASLVLLLAAVAIWLAASR